jgi:superfamily II DNA or RNA helicase
MVTLTFTAGTLELRGLGQDEARLPAGCVWDPRTACHRAPAIAYADLVRFLVRAPIEHRDEARRYGVLGEGARVRRTPRAYQDEALAAWKQARHRGVVILPTGAGKSQVALMAIDDRRRDTLVVAPTLELVRQWYDLLRATFRRPVGIVGGGHHDVQPLTVTTYDSAYLQMEHLGARFGLVVFDEVHHLPSAAYAFAARASLAPFRLGLTATLERADGREAALAELVGPTVYRKDIVEMAGEFLADYDTEQIAVELAPDERAEYEEQRAIYRGFVSSRGIRMSSPDGWTQFIVQASRGEEGARAMRAYRRQRELSLCAPAKLEVVGELLQRHAGDRTLLFTQDNATVYGMSRRFLVPAITHQTKIKERSEILGAFAGGAVRVVATSKVLNEGVDLPSANVAIVVSGSGSVREHVQRLGRILRKQDGKRALLYELVTAQTGETFTSERRREHDAYR